MIDKTTVERIMDAADIVDVIGEFVTLRKKGANYMTCCPFHGEKTPSFSVSPSRGIFKCFGCGKGGNAATFIMEHERMSYVEALKYLAKKYGIEIQEREITEEEVKQNNDRDSMMVVSAYAQQYFTDTLLNSREGKAIGLSYFKERGFNKTAIEKFQLGYCPNSRSAFTDKAIKDGYKKEYLVKTGLTIERDNGTLFDRFYGRVIFPIHSLSGRVIGFGGRTLKTDKNIAKYLNSPESEIYIKSNTLYGIYFAKQQISRLQKCYLVEGYTDVISMYQAGIENVVASSGTSLTNDQIKLIARFTLNVTVLYDGDPAGIKASLRGIDMLLEQGMNVKVALLPEREDPDSYTRTHTADEFRAFLDANETDFISFKISLLLSDTKNDPIKKSVVITDVVHSISVIPDTITRTVYLRECSRMLDMEEDILRMEVAKLRKKKLFDGTPQKKQDESGINEANVKTPAIPAFVSNIYCQEQEKELIYYMLHNGTDQLFRIPDESGEEQIINVARYIINEIRNDDLEFHNLYYKQIFQEYDQQLAEGDAEPVKHFINHMDNRICELTINLLSEEYKLSTIWNQGDKPHIDLSKAVPRAIAVYKSKIVNIALVKIGEQLETAQREKNDDEVTALIPRIITMNEQRKFFATMLERIIL
ncbi:MAG: DNA primase [Prevotellaceae bacterium]|jgi:DNA primase|nr:DNA primase [Prevotellaceae bacterium]